MTDQQLITAYQGGDKSAFRHLYARYKDRIYWFVYRYVRNRCDAEDITQNTFLRLIRFKNQYRQTGAKFTTWLHEIAKMQVYSFWQYNQAGHRIRNSISIQAEQDQDKHRPLQLIDPGFSPEELTDHSIGMQIYQKRLNRMNDDFSDAYRLYVENFSYQEIAKTLNIPLNTVKSRISRARKYLL